MVLAFYGGFFCCIIPGIIFALWFMLCQYVVVIERIAGPSALGRSKDLMKGEMGKAFVLGLIIFVINLSLGGASALNSAAAGATDRPNRRRGGADYLRLVRLDDDVFLLP